MKITFPGVPVKTRGPPGDSKALPGSPEGASEKVPGAFRAPLGLPFGHLAGSFCSKVNDLEVFFTENHVPEVEENEES